MNKIVHKVVSLFLVILITLLVLHYTNIVTFTDNIRDLLSFATLMLIIFSSTAVICSNGTSFNKFINYLIIIGTFAGIGLYIIQGKFNYIIYAVLLFALVSSLMDMFYKKP